MAKITNTDQLAATIFCETVIIDFEEYLGDSFEQIFNLTDESPTPVVLPLSSYTAEFLIYTDVELPPVLTVTETTGIILADVFPNLTVKVNKTSLSSIGRGDFVHKIRLTNVSGYTNTAFTGKFVLL